MKIDATRAAGFARNWPAEVRLLLLHGHDLSASRDLAGQIAAGQAAAGAGVTELIGAALKDDPQALLAAVSSLSMFGDRELLRIDGLDEDGLAAVAALLAGPVGHPVLAVAGALKKGSKLLALAEANPGVAACLQYEASLRDAAKLLADMAGPLGLRLDRDAADALFLACDGDRSVMRRELEKFALYTDASATTQKRLTMDDLAALGAVSGEADLFAPIAAVTTGNVREATDLMGRLPDGVAIPLLRGLERRFMQLATLRADVDAGDTPDAVVNARGQAIFFKEKQAVKDALGLWSQRAIAGALAEVLAAERAVKASGGLADLGVHELVLGLTRRAAAAKRGR